MNLCHDRVEWICDHYFQGRGTLQHFEFLSGGAVNTTLKIRWANEWFVLRLYVRDENLPSIEKALYELVQGRVSTPQMLYASSLEGSYAFAIFRFCDKPQVDDVGKVHVHALSYDIGLALAKIHHFRFPQAGLLGKGLEIEILFEKGSAPYLEYCLEHLTPSSLAWQRLGEGRSKQMLSFINENRDSFPIICDFGVLVHSDFKPVNLLWDKKDGLTVLDWEFAHSGDRLLDFGILLRHFADFPLRISSLEGGYEANGGHLPSSWIQKARITDFVNIVQMLNARDFRGEFFEFLISSVDFTMDNWERLLVSIIG